MSLETKDEVFHNDTVDVNHCKENVSINEARSDSGVSNVDSCSTGYTPSSDSDVSPLKSAENHEKESTYAGIETGDDSGATSPISISPHGNDLIYNIPNDKEYLITNENSTGNVNSSSTKDSKSDDFNSDNDRNNLLGPGDIVDNTEFTNAEHRNVNINLTSSSVSLNEQNMPSIKSSIVITKSLYSKSAENISAVEETLNNVEKKLSNDEINTDEVLSEFQNKKAKVAAVQKIPEQTQSNDPRYTRIPKELIPQDLGSIVKNVHGIFSTMSGSLKNAYNNTQRISMQKVPVKNIAKPIPNGKVMNYIFEEDSIQETGAEKVAVEKGNDEVVTTDKSSDTKTDSESVDSDNDTKRDMLKLQVETLERLLAEQRKENASLRERTKKHIDELQEKDQTFKELEHKLDLMSKRVEQAEREKDAAVMRYASVECAGIEARRAAEKASAAERAALNEVELLHTKLKSAHGEKQRICQLYDDKCHELSNSERELSKAREDLREMEGRLKWTQSKLCMEMDAYKESAERAEKLSQQVTELEAAKDAALSCAGDSAKAKQLESELKESQAALILCKHEKQETEKRLSVTSQQLETCVRERDAATSALAAASAEVEKLKVSNLRLEEEAAELAALRAQAALADTLSAQLQRESERCSRAEAALCEARAVSETCARREAAALEHAARLTAQHVRRRNDTTATHDKVQALTADNTSLRERISALEAEAANLTSALTAETERRNRENKTLARKVAELTEELGETNKKLEWEKGENGVLKKKHASAIKELNRELQRALKRCEQLESKLPPPDATSTRTGSITSLSSGESAPHEERLQNGHTDSVPEIQVREPDRQALIERIVSLQRAAARRAERCEFLEEHSRQLTGELRNKARLLRHLLSSMPAGAVTSQDRDANKKEIARLGGGAMAAVYGGDPAGMTLELSLEMNKRLQAVLEDALLNNITLKENMETLGAEISRLKDGLKPGEASKSN